MNLASMVRWVLFGQKRILNLQLVHKIMLINLYNSGKIRDVRRGSGSNNDIKNRYAFAASNRNAQLVRSRRICFTYRINYKMRINGHRN